MTLTTFWIKYRRFTCFNFHKHSLLSSWPQMHRFWNRTATAKMPVQAHSAILSQSSCTQTKLIKYHSSSSPSILFCVPFRLCLTVAVRPSQLPSSNALPISCWFFQKQYIFTGIKMTLVWTNGISTTIAHAQTWDNQRPGWQDMLLTCPSPTQKERYKSRKDWLWPGLS